MKVWIARDSISDSRLQMFIEKPEKCSLGQSMWWDGKRAILNREWFPEIKNGECYEAEITLGEKV